jgi:membrane-bound ClpP family serine protease
LELLLPIALILIGVSLIVAEVYLIPGLNIVGVFGALMVLFAIGIAFVQVGILGGVMALLAATGFSGGAFWWLWTSGAWNKFILVASLKPDDKVLARESEHRSSYLGKKGRAITPLRPTGIAEIDGERIEVVTEGDFISAGSDVKVVAMDRRKHFVRLVTDVKS